MGRTQATRAKTRGKDPGKDPGGKRDDKAQQEVRGSAARRRRRRGGLPRATAKGDDDLGGEEVGYEELGGAREKTNGPQDHRHAVVHHLERRGGGKREVGPRQRGCHQAGDRGARTAAGS